jgi:hypothetical protein
MTASELNAPTQFGLPWHIVSTLGADIFEWEEDAKAGCLGGGGPWQRREDFICVKPG